MKIVTILGARPQFIKAAAVSREIAKHKKITEAIVHTGQHFDKNMSHVFFQEMHLPKPKYHLNINSLSHGAMTGRMLEEVEKIVGKEKPDYVLVYGDTNSTLAGALAAKKIHCKVAHVEAGLRSFNRKMPEEINRILTDRISDILFCPTDTAAKNLVREGFRYFDCSIIKCGDVMLDAALFYSNLSEKKSSVIQKLRLTKYVLCTIHRAENTDTPDTLSAIVNALNKINREIPVIVPLHPRTQKKLAHFKLKADFTIIEPVGYLDMIALLKHCSLVMTDSGGLQKESFFFKKHCVTLRDETEWVELEKNGYCIVAGTKETTIYQAYLHLIHRKSDFRKNLYGNGKASEVIVRTLLKNY